MAEAGPNEQARLDELDKEEMWDVSRQFGKTREEFEAAWSEFVRLKAIRKARGGPAH